jgi:hypothetical protein
MILGSQAYLPMELMGFVETSWSYWMILVPQSLSIKENSRICRNSLVLLDDLGPPTLSINELDLINCFD